MNSSANNSKQWPDQILEFQGVPDFPAFEESRKDLVDPHEDLFITETTKKAL
ncbi:MAG: hypothetical protein Q7V63_03710 [Gammaproteobacteria bacterium]|nr:hypothetical protein [Gammaproteobacteria bacterium]